MTPDVELDLWRREWQSQGAVPADLRKKVERQSRWMKIGLALDLLVTIVIGGGVIAYALQALRADRLLLAAATWSFIFGAWAFVLTVNRRAWSSAGLDAAGFVDLSLRRCRGALAAIWFAAAFYTIELTFCLAWLYPHVPPPRPSLLDWLFGSWFLNGVWVVTVGFYGFLVWYRIRKNAELAALLQLQRESGSIAP